MLIIHPAIPISPEFLVTVNDWLHHPAVTYDHQNPVAREKSGTGEMIVDIKNRDFILDNNHVTIVEYYGALVNGRGRWNDLPYPLTLFEVTEGQQTRFRVASTGVEYSFEISVDGHKMDIVAVDGSDIHSIRVDSFMIHTGETIDFKLVTNQTPGRYWMRAVTIRQGVGPNPQADGIVKGVKAIISYAGTNVTGDPSSSERICSSDAPCRVFGCPYGNQPVSHNKTCIGQNNLMTYMFTHQ